MQLDEIEQCIGQDTISVLIWTAIRIDNDVLRGVSMCLQMANNDGRFRFISQVAVNLVGFIVINRKIM